jgi:hypothetical protein
MLYTIPLKQNEIDSSLKVGKITAALLANKIAINYYNGGKNNDELAELDYLYSWIYALEGVKEVNTTGSVQLITYTTTQSYQVGDVYNGGRIVYISGTNVLVMSEINYPNAYPWKPATAAFTVLGNTVNTFGKGLSNTNNIIADYFALTPADTNYLAKKVSLYNYNGYTDWYIPSRDEMYQILKAELDSNFTLFGGLTFTAKDIYYMTSTEQDTGSSGVKANNFKGVAYRNTIPGYASTSPTLIQDLNISKDTTSNMSIPAMQTWWLLRVVRSDTIAAPVTSSTISNVTSSQYVVKEYQNYLDEEHTKKTIENINNISKKYLSSLIIKKWLQNPLKLL